MTDFAPCTRAVRAGIESDAHHGAVVPALHLSTNYTFEGFNRKRRYDYSRSGNPTRDLLAEALAELEEGEGAVVTASGMAAVAVVLELVPAGGLVLAAHDCYGGTWRLLDAWAKKGRFRVIFANLTDPAKLADALIEKPDLVWIETPSNPLLRVVDIEAVAAIAHRGGALCAVDNTWGTPVLQRPLELGADISMHSTTKYLGGHSDVLSGALIIRDDRDLYQRINTAQMVGGAVPSPFECWLAMRGIRTLAVRVRAQSASAAALASFLETHPCVERVHYPGLSSHAGHAVAARQMRGFGGMLSVQAGKNREQSLAVAGRLKLFTQATSLGGTESLIEHRASVEGPETRAPENLLRVSVGLEHIDDLKEDFDQALRG